MVYYVMEYVSTFYLSYYRLIYLTVSILGKTSTSVLCLVEIANGGRYGLLQILNKLTFA